MKRILVGMDGSPESTQAAEFAAGLGLALRADLTLVYVTMPPLPLGPERPVHDEARWHRAQREYGEDVLREASASCAGKGRLHVETRIETGPVAETLARLAAETAAEFVVVGHRGRGAVRRLLLGSVADRLVQISTRPVLVWREAEARHGS